MNSKTAKAVDKAFLKLEKEFARFLLVVADVRTSIQNHYSKQKK